MLNDLFVDTFRYNRNISFHSRIGGAISFNPKLINLFRDSWLYILCDFRLYSFRSGILNTDTFSCFRSGGKKLLLCMVWFRIYIWHNVCNVRGISGNNIISLANRSFYSDFRNVLCCDDSVN